MTVETEPLPATPLEECNLEVNPFKKQRLEVSKPQEPQETVEATPVGEAPLEEEKKMEDPCSLQLRIQNVHKHVYQKDFKKFLDSHGIECLKFKKAPKCDFALMHFESLEQKESAAKALEGLELKGRQLQVSQVQPRQRVERPRVLSEEELAKPPSERIADQVTPLWRLSYEEQLIQKQDRFKKVLLGLRRKVYDFFPRSNKNQKNDFASEEDLVKEQELAAKIEREMSWIKDASKENQGLACPLLDIVPSPQQTHYRNKCEFTFGFDLEGAPSLGFLLGMYKEGITTVLSPDDCLHIKLETKTIVKSLEQHAKSSQKPVYDKLTRQGFWRLVQIRNLDSKETLVLVQAHPQSYSEQEITEEKLALKKFFEEHEELKNMTLLFQVWDGVFNGIKEDVPSEILLGTGYVHETLLGLKYRFRISPTAFFQVNTPATESLYSTTKNWIVEAPAASSPASSDGSNIILLDLCCGTGTIGQTMASHVKKVIGVEMVAEAIQDAECNAKLNGIENVDYIHSKVEEAIQKVFKEHVTESDQVVAILDPPRSGVHSSVIQAIRGCSGLKRVIYISCDAEAASSNFLELLRPSSKKYLGTPFQPLKAQAFDLFPQTKHCEFLIEFCRA